MIKIKSEDYYLIFTFLLIGISIILKAYFSQSGYLTSDSLNYFKLTNSLINGEGFYSGYSWEQDNLSFFSIWPVGYPCSIYLFTKISGLSIFWASKFLNISFIGLILILFKILFNKNAFLFGLIFLFASYIETFTYSLSEGLFITGLVWMAFSFYFFNYSKNIALISINILLSSLTLFLSRYIGAFSVSIITLFTLYYTFIEKNKLKSKILFSIIFLNILFIALYLYNNYLKTGFITGAFRRIEIGSNLKLLKHLLNALVAESIIPFNNISSFSILFFALQFLIIAIIIFSSRSYFFKPIQLKNSNKPLYLSLIFGIIGVIYIIFIIVIRWKLKFNWWNFRLLSPGSFMIFISILIFLKNFTQNEFFIKFKKIWITLALISWFINVPYSLFTKDEQNKCSTELQKGKNQFQKGIHLIE
ncbi:hypothetical protein [Aestuariibaculum suncheonense]|uniref:Uncharacterized protein n=1 Tax=Aestuariibaculum suncheonense TaxID=1028745 RepID=A0A8J6UMC1_9FLAO|nr:hypothetical protein [Aestuariibaculum suncheonense]MBD0836806.1 hypothetical protein [Aestuariibaculum suncheonense]